MTFTARVEGGTGAGRKRPPLPANTVPWACKCPRLDGGSPRPVRASLGATARKLNPGYLVRCIDCGAGRP